MKNRLIATALAAVMLLGLAACGGTGTGTTTPTTKQDADATTAADATTTAADETDSQPKELVTLQVFSMPSNTSGLQDNSYWAEILKRDLNVQIELLPAGDEAVTKMASLMASQSLPDIVVFKDHTTYVSDAIEANMIINLDEHKDALPNVFANASMALQFMRDSVSFGTGNAYAVPTGVTNQVSKAGSIVGPYLRWDLYTELGMPAVKDIEDYLPILKDMLELEPTNQEGQPNYGISIFDDWDGSVSWPVRIISEMYGVTQDGLYFMEHNINDGSLKSIYEDDSYFKRAIKFYYQANQMGVMDPDLITDTFDDYAAKASAGRSLFQLYNWTSWGYENAETMESGRTYLSVYFDNERQIAPAPSYVGGASGDAWFAISSTSKNVDAALSFLDYVYSYDGLWNLAWGDQGIAWDIGADGKPYRTELGWEMKNDQKPFENGGMIAEGLNSMNAFGMPWTVVHPVYGARMDELDWTKADFAPASYDVEIDWQTKMNANDDLDYVFKNGLYVEKPFAPQLPPLEGDLGDLKLIADALAAENKVATYKMIVAKDDAEFDALWSALVATAEEIGVAELDAWVADQFAISAAEGAQYMY